MGPPELVPPKLALSEQAALSRADSEALARRRRGRNVALLVALLVLCAVFYALTWVKMTKA